MKVFYAIEVFVSLAFSFAASYQTFDFCIYAGSLIISGFKFLNYNVYYKIRYNKYRSNRT